VALLRLASKVRSGDSANVESQGARKYWQELYQVTGRRREKQGANDPVNSRLNFGYTIVRSLVARSLVAAGLQPALGVGHHSTENALNLADDFIEPYRCLVERFVVSHLSNEPLTSIVKKELAELISEQVKMNGQEYRLPSAIMETVNSYVRILERGEGRLSLPDWPLEG
jgi:CRISPR-associated protein Cas1